ncbi:hypothetical protein GCM10009785_01000 [Brooklawnia cerclae]|uniref:Nucleotide-binding universal stress UspA family protein n=1 Tax=Brooklawnia cerclae TaxID=349934 RepID=A0ABX0SI47_9ACTN|nr:universal stress protein [Brooklawnia cerclae]NIH56306.1 nucleotide-binding universal stress UspA family protein [Brooklawnia cerclae]
MRDAHTVPQPSLDRITPPGGHPFVVGVVPDQASLVALTAARWAADLPVGKLYFAFVDTSRITIEEHTDGSVRHAALDPDSGDDEWLRRRDALESGLHALLDPIGTDWEFRYLAGAPDRALTHLARAVDASAIVVGTRAPGVAATTREFIEGSVAARLAHHQHRPVLIVPLAVTDWSNRIA